MQNPRLALLSSFCATGIEEFLRTHPWPAGVAVEFYAAMHHDRELLLGSSALATGDSALNVLARLGGKPKAVEAAADAVAKCFHGLEIAAISTFLPEITAADSHAAAWRSAQDALIFLVKLAATLRARGHPICTVEIVSGSAIEERWLALGRHGYDMYMFDRADPAAAIERLAERLVPVAQAALDAGVTLAVELEPGPLFTIGTLDAMRNFAQILDSSRHEGLRCSIGFNLDVPHWAFLGQIEMSCLRRETSVLRRIVHAHICDHSCGHLGDSRPLLFNGEARFKDWLALIGDLTAGTIRQRSPLKFSGYLTCELECCRDTETIEASLKTLREMIDRWC
jgi:sugar phosphate isomerase/epimerase